MNEQGSQIRNDFTGKLLDILMVFSPILVFGVIGTQLGLEITGGILLVNLGYVISILVGGWVLRKRNSSWLEIGLSRPGNWLKTVIYGIATFIGGIIVFVLIQNVAASIPGLNLAPIDATRFSALEGNLTFLIIGITGAWTTIAFGEELFYRAFLITRFKEVFSSTKLSSLLAILSAGAFFGAAHFAEGPVGIAANGAFGILFGWIYHRSKQNLWITIIGQGLMNTLRFFLVYAGITG